MPDEVYKKMQKITDPAAIKTPFLMYFSEMNYPAASRQGIHEEQFLTRSKYGELIPKRLDVTFGEDTSRKRKNNEAENFNMLLKATITLLAKDKTPKFSKKRKCLQTALDFKYRERLLGCSMRLPCYQSLNPW